MQSDSLTFDKDVSVAPSFGIPSLSREILAIGIADTCEQLWCLKNALNPCIPRFNSPNRFPSGV